MTKDEIIDKLWENSGHGTRREDIAAAFEAGEKFSAKPGPDFLAGVKACAIDDPTCEACQ